MVLTNEAKERGWGWYAEHQIHVIEMLEQYDKCAVNPAFAPSGSDCSHPELWKCGHWKWFLRQGGEATMLTDEAREKLIDYVEKLLREWEVDSVKATILLRGCDTPKRRGLKKDAKLVKIRDDLIWHLWSRCWQGCGASFLVDHDDPGGERLSGRAWWQPLSHPNIASVLGLDHSTVTRSLKRTREKRREEAMARAFCHSLATPYGSR